MAQYWLAQHVHLCVTNEHVVLLDLKRDKYLGVGPRQMPALASNVKGWPIAVPDAGTTHADGLLEKMLANGMLTTDAAQGKEAVPAHMPRPEAVLIEEDFDRRPRVSFMQLAGFVRASIGSRLALRWRSIEDVIIRVQRRKQGAASGASGFDFAAARAHVDAFLYLQPLLFGARDDLCLPNSLALVNFLARRGFHPTWVFGVQTAPFAAHCWVQAGDVVINDTPDHVRRYAPILTV